MNTDFMVTSIKKLNNEIAKHSPVILVCLGITGMVTTVVMASKATPKAKDILEALHEKQEEAEEENTKVMKVLKDVKAVTPVYIPSIIMGSVTIACIIGSYSISTKRTAALATAYGISERTLKEYQSKVVETIGEKKEEKIRDEIVKDKVKNDPPSNHEVICPGTGDMLCYDAVFGRYFTSNIEKLRKIANDLNRKLSREMYVSVNEFCDEIDIPHTRLGNDIGWNVDDDIDFDFTSTITEDDRPCLIVNYDICPRFDFRNLR